VLDSPGYGWGSVTGYCERGNKPSGAIRGGGGGRIFDLLSDTYLLRKDSSSRS
jgi:hypothetical protein